MVALEAEGEVAAVLDMAAAVKEVAAAAGMVKEVVAAAGAVKEVVEVEMDAETAKSWLTSADSCCAALAAPSTRTRARSTAHRC